MISRTHTSLARPDLAYVRSPVAHGTITSIDAAEAAALPGVVAVLTGADLELQPVASAYNPTVARPLLAMERVRYVGEPIAARRRDP